MKRKIVLAVVLCLAVVALLGVAAAPAAAATCTDCHVSPDGPPAPACGDMVTGVDCATCHKGMSPHPDLASLVKSALDLWLWDLSTDTGYELRGRLGKDITGFIFLGHPGVVVYLQQRLWGATDFTDLTQVTTEGRGGWFTYTVASPTPWAAYRAIAQGHVFGVVPRLYMPQRTTLLPTPGLTLKLGGLTDRSITLGRSVTAKGTAAPTLLTGENVGATVFVKGPRTGRWLKAKSGTAEISATGTYAWKYTPGRRGSFRVRAAIAATDNHNAVTTTWRYFKVK